MEIKNKPNVDITLEAKYNRALSKIRKDLILMPFVVLNLYCLLAIVIYGKLDYQILLAISVGSFIGSSIYFFYHRLKFIYEYSIEQQEVTFYTMCISGDKAKSTIPFSAVETLRSEKRRIISRYDRLLFRIRKPQNYVEQFNLLVINDGMCESLSAEINEKLRELK